MKKIIFVVAIFGTILAISSCNHDDSNDIDVISPVDSTTTGIVQRQ